MVASDDGLTVASATARFPRPTVTSSQALLIVPGIVCVLLTLLSAAAGTAQSISREEALQKIREAQVRITKSENLRRFFEEGTEAKAKAIELDGRARGLAGEYLELARKQISKQWEVAIEAFEQASALDPKEHVIWGNLADCYSALANFGSGAERENAINKAAEAFAKAIELKPDDAGYHYSYALTLVKLLRFNVFGGNDQGGPIRSLQCRQLLLLHRYHAVECRTDRSQWPGVHEGD